MKTVLLTTLLFAISQILQAQTTLTKGSKVEFDRYGDGSTWESGTIIEVEAAGPGGCAAYAVSYDSNPRYTFRGGCKTVRLISTSKITSKSVTIGKQTSNKTADLLTATLLIGEYGCYQPYWDYATSTNKTEGRGSLTLTAKGTYQLLNNGNSGHYEFNADKNEIKFHDGLEGAIGKPYKAGKDVEMTVQFATKAGMTWTCRTHKK